MADTPAIVVLGAGPAGAATALGLAALGYDVSVVHAPATRALRESFSARVVAALRALGVEEALEAIDAPCVRRVAWAGELRELPGEALALRGAFDRGLARALARHGVRLAESAVAHVEERAGGARVQLAEGERIEAQFLVEARGRAAPASGERTRGPATTCVVQAWRVPERAPQLAVVSLPAGWAWLADDGRGALTTQLALDAREAATRAGLAAQLAEALRANIVCAELLAGASPVGDAFARGASAQLDGALASERSLRVGDAALAVDPLSGNGVFQALSTALVAPAVINTLLRRPERAQLAREFYVARAREVFLRFARVSRDFYAAGAAHHGGAFWQTRAAWPDAEPAEPAGGALALALRPVVCDGFIEEREVAVSAARPLGTWRVGDIELAPLVRALRLDPARAPALVAELPETARTPVASWLRAHGLLPAA